MAHRVAGLLEDMRFTGRIAALECQDPIPVGPALSAMYDRKMAEAINTLLPAIPWVTKGDFVEGEETSRGYIELVGWEGIEKHSDLRMGLYWQDAYSFYPFHRHNAEELYLVLSGESGWAVDYREIERRMPGQYILHQSRQDHATETFAQPLLALWAWQGDLGWDSYSMDKGFAKLGR